MANSASASSYSSVVHGLAVTLTLAVFPLIWVGGLVTTYDAGMAVPDWPGTYGWNMFAYPATTWLFGPFDLMVEHSHRLLGSLAGLLSIGLVVAAFRCQTRNWFRWWSIGILVAVIAQGVLGGARVTMDQRTFAMIHGCTGPLFFALATATAVFSSRWWLSFSVTEPIKEASESDSPAFSTGRVAAVTATVLTVSSYLQLIVGAQLRHVTGNVNPKIFTGWVHLHLSLAAMVAVIAVLMVLLSTFGRKAPIKVRRPAQLVVLIVLVQISLGIGTWIVNYALPWSEGSAALAAYTIESKGFFESLIVTAHMATGSLIISLATMMMLRGWRSRALAAPVEPA